MIIYNRSWKIDYKSSGGQQKVSNINSESNLYINCQKLVLPSIQS